METSCLKEGAWAILSAAPSTWLAHMQRRQRDVVVTFCVPCDDAFAVSVGMFTQVSVSILLFTADSLVRVVPCFVLEVAAAWNGPLDLLFVS